MAEMRADTPFGAVRPSDAKTFMLASRHPRTVSEIARALGVSRQATHRSIQRLMDRGVIELRPAPGSRRDKIAVVTEAGHLAREEVAQQLEALEAELEALVGIERLEALRQILLDLTRAGAQQPDS